jgi:predicted RNase H-like HicB family nuclease
MNFNTASAGRICGVTARQLDYWDRTHVIKPSVREASGHGSARLYSFMDLIQLRVVKTLKDKGISLQKIRKALRYLRKHMPDIDKPLADLRFLTDGETIFVITREDKKMIDTLRHGQLIFTMALGEIIDELKGQVRDLSDRRTYRVKVKGRMYPVVLHADTEDGGYWVESPDIPGCASQGDTVEEALEMISDAIDGCLGALSDNVKIKKAR